MKHPFDVHVGGKIRQSRCNAELSMEELGMMLGVSTLQIQSIEAGGVHVDPELLRRVVEILDAPATFYFEGLAAALR